MKQRLIDAEALKKRIYDEFVVCDELTVGEFVRMINAEPTVEPEFNSDAFYDAIIKFRDEEIRTLKTRPDIKEGNDHYCNLLSRLFVLDKSDGRIHRIGDERHDSLCVMGGEIHYHNMQNGDGGTTEDKEGYGYVILKTMDGSLGSPDLAVYGYAPDERFIDQIAKYIEEQEKEE